jgi:Na+-transporting NADH:ubiquinone oxidoreductase subunit C
MNSVNPVRWWTSFLDLPNSNRQKTIGIALLVALVCSFAVSLTAVTLKPLHDANRLRESAASLVEVMESLGFDLPRARMVDLASGAYVVQNPAMSIVLDSARDLAGLGAIESVAEVYELRRDNRLELVVLPVRGTGYQSLIKGFLVLQGDLETIAALTFHEQNETPGLGAKIANKTWQASWIGRRVKDADGAIRIRAVRGKSAGVHEVDGISGATRTMNGINNMLRFWLGPDGYGPYLARLKSEAGQ